MRTVLSGVMTIALTILLAIASPLQASATSLVSADAPDAIQLATLPGLKGAFTGKQPDNIGVVDGQLAGCPSSPNCVVSQNGDEAHAIAPIAYTTDLATARANLIDILSVVPRTKVVRADDSYILAESESRLMGFVDDSEFYFPAGQNVIQVRAAARMGESDLGVNRRRIEQIRLAFQDLEQRLGNT